MEGKDNRKVNHEVIVKREDRGAHLWKSSGYILKGGPPLETIKSYTVNIYRHTIGIL